MQTHTTGAERRKNLQGAWKWARENVHNKKAKRRDSVIDWNFAFQQLLGV